MVYKTSENSQTQKKKRNVDFSTFLSHNHLMPATGIEPVREVSPAGF